MWWFNGINSSTLKSRHMWHRLLHVLWNKTKTHTDSYIPNRPPADLMTSGSRPTGNLQTHDTRCLITDQSFPEHSMDPEVNNRITSIVHVSNVCRRTQFRLQSSVLLYSWCEAMCSLQSNVWRTHLWMKRPSSVDESFSTLFVERTNPPVTTKKNCLNRWARSAQWRNSLLNTTVQNSIKLTPISRQQTEQV